MSDDMNKNELEETTEEITEEVTEKTEDVIENAAEKAEEFVEAVKETAENTIDSAAEAAERAFSSLSDETPKGNKTALIVIGIIVALIVVAVGIFGVMVYNVKKTNDTLSFADAVERTIHYNKYNNLGYINVSGRDLAQVAEDAGMTVDEFKEEYSLPADMKPNTDESAAYYMMPVSKMAEMNNVTVDQIKEMMKITDIEITDSTPWGEVEGEVTIATYVGESQIDSFKEFYGMGDEVTGETKWKEVRNIIDKKALEDRLAEEAKMAEQEANTETNTNTESEGEAQSTDSNVTEEPSSQPAETEATDKAE